MALTLPAAEAFLNTQANMSLAGATGWQRHFHKKWLDWAQVLAAKSFLPPVLVGWDPDDRVLYHIDTASEATFDFGWDLEHAPGDITDPGYNPFNRPT